MTTLPPLWVQQALVYGGDLLVLGMLIYIVVGLLLAIRRGDY